MRMTRIARAASIGAWAVAAALMATSVVAREDAILAVAYGNGVHAYYAGDYQRSPRLQAHAPDRRRRKW